MQKNLIVLLGPTGVGKTDLSVDLANYYNAKIVSSDSRQVYKEMRIGTAVPPKDILEKVEHHLIHTHSIHDYYSAWECEKSAISIIDNLHKESDFALLVGGSMMYIQAVCEGIDEIPTIDAQLRADIVRQYEEKGAEHMRMMLKKLDPVFYDQVDLKNTKRVIHAVEICIMSGKPYSELRTNSKKLRDFNIIKVGLNIEREILYNRINTRVDQMMDEELLAEVKKLYQYKHLNSLNTVGYKELFQYLDGEITLEIAVDLIKRDTRRYAKKQISWFKRDNEIQWFEPKQKDEIIDYINRKKI
ncbi:MAG: tRNA (adenosine(37)-N6)-dimethylallyltransferase MiaA [Marinifilaceae bacterium]|jgi:tRNA dimethylallyltransferase|nr:tRNA (adenosine(37)-N6)-dimethylallyltransferase MiaA [Marinifilaceae bacterium]